MSRIKLTKRRVDAAIPGQCRYLLWDTDLPGFGLKVEPSGRKVYVLQYRLDGRPPRRYTIGRHGDLTLTQARQEAGRLRADIARGEDPAARRQRTRQAPTVQELATRYMAEHAEVKKKASSIASDRRMWRLHVLPALGSLRVAEVNADDIARLHFRMRKSPYQANRVLSLLSKAFSLAERWGWRAPGSNPVKGIDRYREKRRERMLTGEEVQRLGQVLDEIEQEGQESPWVVAAIRLLLLTGCRKNEILKLRWHEVDLDNRVLRLGDSKTGEKVVPLSAPAVEILSQLPRLAGNPHVIPGLNPGSHFVGLHRIWDRIRTQADLPDLRLHDLRHHFASVAAVSGLSLPLLGAMLGHRSPATTARYLHWQHDPLVAAADLVAGSITSRLQNHGAGAAEEAAPQEDGLRDDATDEGSRP